MKELDLDTFREGRKVHFWLQRVVAAISKHGWKISLAILAVLFVGGFIAINLTEPQAEFADIEVYWWWFLVTVTTVGYGDFFPSTFWSRIMGSIVVIGGISAFGVVLTQITASMGRMREAIMSGTAALDEKDHLVIFGWYGAKTREVIRELWADSHRRFEQIVLCFGPDQADENPMPEHVKAVKGKLTSADMLQRACVDRAQAVVLDGHTDDEVLRLAVAVRSINSDAHMVAAVEELEEARLSLHHVDPKIDCVPDKMSSLIVDAVQDPGVTQIYNELMSNVGGEDALHHLRVPGHIEDRSFGDLFLHFKRDLDATLLAVAKNGDHDNQLDSNPPWEATISGGDLLYYVARQRLSDPFSDHSVG